MALSLTVPFVGVLVNVSKANEAILPVEAAQVLDNFAPILIAVTTMTQLLLKEKD